ncbi:MAG: hypothetical protein JW715_10555 [Sedimentisphaerales bacterium]|nr:hypothetical protein [Sedimentisphaerales bacterium]
MPSLCLLSKARTGAGKNQLPDLVVTSVFERKRKTLEIREKTPVKRLSHICNGPAWDD